MFQLMNSLIVGNVTALIDFSHLKPDGEVLNGIAYDAKNDRIFVTGKWWSKLFHVEVFPKPIETSSSSSASTQKPFSSTMSSSTEPTLQQSNQPPAKDNGTPATDPQQDSKTGVIIVGILGAISVLTVAYLYARQKR